jgi:NAD(P)-dependent dehydrogenase (short-subunit alcohol dehydrogenase family)
MTSTKTWLITGAGRGMGLDIAKAALAAGHNLVATGRNPGAVAEALGDGGNPLVVKLDVTSTRDAEAAVQAAVDRFGGIDVLVNNAGSEVQGPIDTLADADFEGMLRANVVSVFICTRAALPALRASRGAVINLGSTVVTRPPRGRFGYVASKGAVEAMSRALALDLGRDGIRVNVIRPGIIPSELRGMTEEAERAKFETGFAFGRQALSAVGDGRDVAEAVAWLIGDGGRWVTGAVIDIDGGFTLGAADVL